MRLADFSQPSKGGVGWENSGSTSPLISLYKDPCLLCGRGSFFFNRGSRVEGARGQGAPPAVLHRKYRRRVPPACIDERRRRPGGRRTHPSPPRPPAAFISVHLTSRKQKPAVAPESRDRRAGHHRARHLRSPAAWLDTSRVRFFILLFR